MCHVPHLRRLWGGWFSSCSQANCAELLANNRVMEMSREKRIDAIIGMGMYTECSVAFAKKLLLIETMEVGDDAHLPDILLPWSGDGDKGADKVESFNVLSPRLQHVPAHPSTTVEILEMLLVESVLVTKIMSGNSGEERLMALVAILNDALSNESEKKGMHEAYVEAVDFIRAACAALSVLYDPDPAAISDLRGGDEGGGGHRHGLERPTALDIVVRGVR